MPGRFPLLVPSWSTLSEGLLRSYLWSQDWSVPFFPPLENLRMWKWGSDGLGVRVQDWAGAGWPDPSLWVTQSLMLGGNFWGQSVGSHKASGAQLSPWTVCCEWNNFRKERALALNASIRDVLRWRSWANLYQGLLGNGNTIWMEWPLFNKCLILKSPLNRHWILILIKVQNRFSLAHFFSKYFGVLSDSSYLYILLCGLTSLIQWDFCT